MKYNIDEIKNNINNLEESINELNHSLKSSDWEDEVNDSYLRFNSQCNELLSSIKQTENVLNNTCNELSNINVDSPINTGTSLCSTIRGI